jgi:hypothetical protein
MADPTTQACPGRQPEALPLLARIIRSAVPVVRTAREPGREELRARTWLAYDFVVPIGADVVAVGATCAALPE